MIFEPILDLFRGKAVTIPPLDGAFRPNTLLDDSDVFASLADADNLVVSGQDILASSGNAVFTLRAGTEPSVLKAFEAPVTALAVSPSGELAVALANGRLVMADADVALPKNIACITALAFDTEGALWLANGSAEHGPGDWSRDLMLKGATGSVLKRKDAASGFKTIATGLAYPYGLLPLGTTDVLVSESWRHRLVRIGEAGTTSIVADHLPGYPARLSPASDGGAWLSVFAPRNRLIEFVLQEKTYRSDMIETIPPEFWIAPSLSSGRSFLEPLQCGGIKTMGVHKPWSPSRSCGMSVRLNGALQPVFSLHSRANGVRHGTCSAVEADGRLLVASRGGDCVLTLDAGRGA